ncbi:MAG: 30S ribosomal protein S15, partial [Candidatus Puniceispirillales bacterium]
MSITKSRKAELIAEFGGTEKDSGNPAVQVAI